MSSRFLIAKPLFLTLKILRKIKDKLRKIAFTFAFV